VAAGDDCSLVDDNGFVVGVSYGAVEVDLDAIVLKEPKGCIIWLGGGGG